MADLRLRVMLAAVDKATGPMRKIMGGSKQTARQLAELQRRAGDISQFRKLAAGSQDLSSRLGEARGRVAELARGMRATSNPTRAMQREFNSAVGAARKLSQAHATQRERMQRLRQTMSAAGIDTTKLASHERNLRTEIERTTQVLDRQRRATERLGSARKMQRAGMMTAATGAGAMYGGRRAMMGAGRFLAPGMDFDSGVSAVQSVTRLGRDDPQLQALREMAKAQGASTSFTATQAAEGQFYLGRAGFDVGAIMASMPAMLDLARAGDLELGTAADIFSNISSAMKIDPRNEAAMTQLADQLVHTFTTSNTSMETIGETMKYMAPIVSAAGGAMEDALAMTGMLGNIGLQGSNAGTIGRNIYTRLGSGSTAITKALDELGVDARDSSGNLREVPVIMAEIDRSMRDMQMGSAERLEFVNEVFGLRAIAGASELAEAMGSGAFGDYSAEIAAASGTAQQVAATMADNVKGDVIELTSALEGLRIEIFDQLGPWLRETARRFTEIARGAIAWVQANPELAATLGKIALVLATVITAVGGFLMVAGLSMMMVGQMVKGFVMLTKVLPLVGKGIMLISRAILLNPIGAALTVIAGLAYLVYRNWGTIGPWFANLWDVIWQRVQVVWGGIKSYVVGAWNVIAGIFTGDRDRIVGGLGKMWDAINTIFSGWPAKFLQFGIDMLKGLISGIGSMAGALKDAVVGAVSGAVDKFKGFLGIKSPSRLFAQFGGFTMQGLAGGMEDEERRPLAALQATGKRLARIGGGIALGTALAPAAMASTVLDAAAGIRVDTRPPLAASPPAAAAGATYNITINAPPGSGAQDIAALVRREIESLERERAARSRSRFGDYD